MNTLARVLLIVAAIVTEEPELVALRAHQQREPGSATRRSTIQVWVNT